MSSPGIFKTSSDRHTFGYFEQQISPPPKKKYKTESSTAPHFTPDVIRYSHTHTHTHIYIYMYIYKRELCLHMKTHLR